MATLEFVIDPFENHHLAILGGHLEENFRLLENRIINTDKQFKRFV